MMIRKHRESRTDASIQLSEIDTGMRQCLQALWGCEVVREKGVAAAEQHWMKLAERAWRDFNEDREFVSNANCD